jgi:hypothetical protein
LELVTHQSRVSIVAAIGHGYGGRAGANVMLADDGSFTVTERILAGGTFLVQQGVTGSRPLSSDEADIRARFTEIGRVLRAARVREFVFLVCGVGANPRFMQAIKNAWGGSILVSGYADGVVLQDDVSTGDPTYPRTRLYLWRDGVGNPRWFGTRSSATPRCWLEIPASLVTV